MYYKKIKQGDTVIEFHNNWLGIETIIVNGQIVSKKGSIMGTEHYFNLIEDGHNARYILTTKVNSAMAVFIDLRKNGEIVQEDIPVGMGSKPREAQNKFKHSGIAKIKEYDIEDGIKDLEEGLAFDAKDPEIFFYLACAYSIQEKPKKGFECLKKTVQYHLQDIEMILNHDMLAFLRMEEPFEDFVNSNFKDYDESKLSSGREE